MSLALSILKDIIEIPSENPGGSETAIADYCLHRLRVANIDAEIVSAKSDRPNVVARIDGQANRKMIYQGHLDTKPAYHAGSTADSWTRSPFQANVEGDLVYGLGACDTKGGVAAQLAALIHLSKNWSSDLPTVEWQGVADEENGSLYGSAYLAAQGWLKADLAIVAEPTLGQLSFEQLGSVWSRITVRGKQAHGGMPWLGSDAIAGGLVLIDRVSQLVSVRKSRERDYHPAVGVRMLHGGSHPGTVSGVLEIVADIRLPPNRVRSEFISIWRDEADRLETERNLSIEIEPFLDGGCDANALKPLEMRELCAEAWEAAGCGQCIPHFFMGGTDARFFSAMGTPAVVLGPGSLAQAHIADEFVSIQQLERCETFYTSCPRLLDLTRLSDLKHGIDVL